MIILLACVAAALFQGALFAQTESYFPLRAGDSWLYRLKPGRIPVSDEFRSISVEGKQTVGGQEYFDVRYFGQALLLRDTGNSALVALDRQSGVEKPWLSPGLAEGSTFPAAIDPCSTSGRIVTRNATTSVPAGEFANVVQAAFEGPCADAGATRQLYAPDVGLIVHEETSFAGPRLYELVYYRAGRASAAGPEVSFAVALNAPVYPVGGVLDARLTLRNTTSQPVLLHFPSGQTFDLKIYNEKGDVVFAWSAGRAFALIVRDETFGPGEHTFGLTAPLNNLPAGRYKAQAFITTAPILYTGEVAFEITGN
jgi:hypothetical protein